MAEKSRQPRYKVIACEIFFREICLLAARCDNLLDLEFLRKGLHDAGREKMRQELQNAINDCAVKGYDAIMLAYGRCNDGLAGLVAPDCPLVIPRAHDCITLFFGARQAYDQYFAQFPGTYFRTTGWTERSEGGDDSVMAQLGLNRTYEEYVAKYGKENADYIMESLGGWEKSYKYIAYIELGLPQDAAYTEKARAEAAQRGLEFQIIKGNWRLLENLLAGNWPSEDFLVVPPGQRVAADNEGQILRLE